MLFSFITPEIAIGVGLFLMFTQLVSGIGLGFKAQVFGLSMFEMAYPVIVVRARLLSIGKQYEEAAMDLGASPIGAMRRVLLPLLSPGDLRERGDRVRVGDRQLRDLAAAVGERLDADDPDHHLQLGAPIAAPVAERARDRHARVLDRDHRRGRARVPPLHPHRTVERRVARIRSAASVPATG